MYCQTPILSQFVDYIYQYDCKSYILFESYEKVYYKIRTQNI